MSELRLLALYPDLMNIYADRGNILFLRRRCEWRGIGFSYAASGLGERFDPEAHDLIYIGGGQDRDQVLVAADMVETKRPALASAVEDRAVERARGRLFALPTYTALLELRNLLADRGLAREFWE